MLIVFPEDALIDAASAPSAPASPQEIAVTICVLIPIIPAIYSLDAVALTERPHLENRRRANITEITTAVITKQTIEFLVNATFPSGRSKEIAPLTKGANPGVLIPKIRGVIPTMREMSPIVIICFPRALTYLPRLKIPTSIIIANSIDAIIPSGIDHQIDKPKLETPVAITYTPNAEITPCAKLVVNEVLNIMVIAMVTRAVTHIGTIDPNNVLRK